MIKAIKQNIDYYTEKAHELDHVIATEQPTAEQIALRMAYVAFIRNLQQILEEV